MSKVCRIGVVGVGPLVGLPHAKRIMAHDGAELAAVCDLKPEAAMKEFGVPGYTDPGDMVTKEEIHGVVIATPTHLHLPVLRAILGETTGKKFGLKAVLVEKPICESVASAQELIRVAEDAGVKVLVGHQRRHSPLAKAAREIVSNKQEFGPLRGFTCQWALLKPASYFDRNNPARAYVSEKDKGGPILINMIHDLDFFRFVTGREIVQVFASTTGLARGTEVEDTGAATLQLDDGALGSVFFSDATPSPWNYEFTTGENPKYPPLPVSADKPDCYQFYGGRLSLGFPSLRTCGYTTLSPGTEPGWDAPLTVQSGVVETQDPLSAQMTHFVDVCNGNAEPLCSGRDGMLSMLAILAIKRSAETGLPVKPSQLEDEVESKRQRVK